MAPPRAQLATQHGAALTNATFALIASDRGRPTDAEIRNDNGW
ncbi:MAG: hypothetical protein V7633_3182 [Pseudonocardia sp.]|jgi:hypothetical protein